ncbi:hypothetical protein ACG2F4_11520 [Halalkalibaculum sp. DA3122]|uniref:hypothetical protein n=1 Tax=unclassified Halalkalibaculum TaxID=2964617 RepID=UPI00375425F7
MKHKRKVPHRLFAETRMGIVTRYGDWFHTTTDYIEEFVPGLLEEVELEELVRAAQAWVKSADSLSMLLLLGLLLFVPPLVAALLAVAFHAAWYFNKSSFVMISLNTLMEYLYKDGTQLVTSLVVLSYLGIMGEYFAASIGLLFFFVLKLGLLRKLWDKLFQMRQEVLLTLNDRVMKMVILRFSIRENLVPDDIREMEEQIVSLASSRKKNN